MLLYCAGPDTLTPCRVKYDKLQSVLRIHIEMEMFARGNSFSSNIWLFDGVFVK